MTSPTGPLCLEHTIDGQAVGGRGLPLSVECPSTGEELATVVQVNTAQVAEAVEAAERAFGSWSQLSPQARCSAMERFVDALTARRDRFVALIVAEAGTPVSLTRSLQVDTPLEHMRWYAEQAGRDWTESIGVSVATPRSESIIAHRPTGVVAALTAYNYPLLLAVSKMGAALAAGCTVVLMPSPLAPLSTLLIGEAAREAGLPDGVLNVVVGGAECAIALTREPAVRKISFTGSLRVGAEVMKQAAEGMKGITLELGGKSPNILLPGTDLEAVTAAVHLRYLRNAGQGCASPTRLLVHRSQYDEFIERSQQVFDAVPVGDPWKPETVVGPVISAAHRDRITEIIAAAEEEGAEVVARGHLPSGDEGGYWVAPTLLVGASPQSAVVREEIFGPVAVVIAYDDVDEAVRIANDTDYGLAANIYADDVEQAVRLAGRIQAGLVTINGGGALRPDGVFGGFKASGMGREHGEWGIREFLEPQHVQWSLP
ncbi:aldehyde dehydrogenase family protein [Blastococcus sp. CT_GayMR20]|uniref:aldehyde dehydrogenase family protein n=1 Tax=Blastococcus sp. CT_GayMR20 TaxID=2559609 RepID=UPI0010741E77|nr:aldehyde dehydrogenase family protein [Blastococcus sp. CT_GayMR20]TFV93765.1 aldehyde dehydrogenase family protein [Blastococcus sp. CT_GayMR20]TFV93830.1 aldehyde dehydrogenase family protein [Blastococcus sp. CT_GayMR20]